MERSLGGDGAKKILKKLDKANHKFSKAYPGEYSGRQPVHTVYGGAQLFKYNTTEKIGELALRNFKQYAPNAEVLAQALQSQVSKDVMNAVYKRIEKKLAKEAIEDFRIDFEDGYGNRSDEEEDGAAEFCALEVAKGMKEKTLPPFIGIRIKTLSSELKERAIRTLDIFISTLVKATKGKLPDNFVVTLPKIVIPEQVSCLVEMLEILEKKLKLKKDSLKMEFMIETTQSIFDLKGKTPMPLFLEEAKGRCVSAHFGTYDFTASNSITASYQSMDHPACDFARQMMKLAYSSTGIWLSDGATNVMPVGPHRAEGGKQLSAAQQKENQEVVHRAWKLSYDHIRHSLKHAYYQGWDLHPAQLPIRYAACYLFFLEGLADASARLKNFIEKAAQATLVGDVFDDAATGQGLLNYFLRAMNCGAVSEDEVLATGLTLDEIRTRSFVKILAIRRGKG